MMGTERILAEMLTCAKRAGEAIMDIYGRPGAEEVTYKEDSSPLTAADKASDGVIKAALTALCPECGYLSEESEDDAARLDKRWCFVVDPLDGTKEFLKRNGEFTVNIALCDGGVPVAGAVYLPVTGEMFYALAGKGAFLRRGEEPLFDEATRIRVSDRTDALVLMVSRSHLDSATEAVIAANKERIAQTVAAGSSLKGCRIAQGEADVYYRFGPTMEWDTAAMQCVAEQAGAIFRQGDGTPMAYNRRDHLNAKGFYILNRAENDLAATLT